MEKAKLKQRQQAIEAEEAAAAATGDPLGAFFGTTEEVQIEDEEQPENGELDVFGIFVPDLLDAQEKRKRQEKEMPQT